MRPTGSAAQLELRRHRAVDLLADGKSLTEVARLVEADVSSVKRWKRAWKQGGVTAYTPRYNGACEAGIGGLKVRTHHLAAVHGRPGR